MATAGAIACTNADRRPPIADRFATRDSAGIIIADNNAPRSSDVLSWRVDSGNALRIGTLDGPAATRLAGVRSATLLHSGALAISDGQSREIRVFDSTGAHIVTFGRAGDGPGEFQGGANIEAQAGDTLLAWDGTAFTRSKFSVSGGLLHTERLTYRELFGSLGDTRAWASFLHDGSFLVGGEESWTNRPQHFELYRLNTAVTWVSSDRTTSRKLAAYPGPETFLVPGAVPPNISVERPPFAKRGMTAAGGNPPQICVGDNALPQVHCLQPGNQSLLIRWQQQETPVGAAEIDAWKDERRRNAARGSDESRQRLERILSSAPLPITKPYYAGMMVDDVHNLWVQSMIAAPDTNARATRYEVFSPQGEWLGHTFLPSAVVLEIGAAHVVAVTTNAQGFEVVTLYKLRR